MSNERSEFRRERFHIEITNTIAPTLQEKSISSNAGLSARRTRISLECKYRRVDSIFHGEISSPSMEEIRFRVSLPTLFFVFDERTRERKRKNEKKRKRERERGWLCRRMFFGHWEYTDGFKAGGFSFASDQSSLAVIRNFFFSLPSTAMPREPYAKIRERKRGRKGKRNSRGKGTFVIARTVPLPRSAGYSNALNRQATREIGSDSGKHSGHTVSGGK